MRIEIFDADDKKLVELSASDNVKVHLFIHLYCCDEDMKLKAPIKINDSPLTIMNIFECIKCGKYRKEIIYTAT